MKYTQIPLLFLIILQLFACSEDSSDANETTCQSNPSVRETFDISDLLINYADNLIIPAYENLQTQLSDLKTAQTNFKNSSSLVNLNILKTEFIEAYKAWQYVEPYNLTPEKNLNYRLFMNTFPSSTVNAPSNILGVSTIDQNILGAYSLDLGSTIDQQGFPAVDYLLYGISSDENGVFNIYNGLNGGSYHNYLSDVIDRMLSLTNNVLGQWKSGFRDTFVSNTGNANSESTNIFFNEYINHYERYLREKRIVTPANIRGDFPTTLPFAVEAFYANDFSKTLFLESLTASERIYKGVSFDGSTDGMGADDYLIFLGRGDLDQSIFDQFSEVRTTANVLQESFSDEINEGIDGILRMDNVFDELQVNTNNLKVDMMICAFGINATIVDTDGD